VDHVSFYRLDPPGLAVIEEAGEREIIVGDESGRIPVEDSDTADDTEKKAGFPAR
jgi:hypothetical protein